HSRPRVALRSTLGRRYRAAQRQIISGDGRQRGERVISSVAEIPLSLEGRAPLCRPSPKDEHLFSSSCPVFLNAPHCWRAEIFHERLKLEERSFTIQPTSIPDELPVGPDHPVTRDDNRDRISPVRQTNSPRNISHFFRLG